MTCSIWRKSRRIAQEHHAKLFHTYQRLGHENTIIEGTGLGLSIVKQLLQLMHGDISFTSKLHEGTTFVIKLPVSGNAEQSALPGGASKQAM